MAFDQKNNEGVVFANDKKQKDSDPDGTGSATIDGVQYWVNTWTNKSKGGVPYRKLSFRRKESVPQNTPASNGGI